ncbi:hypothetical protein EZH22_24330 [Xanthobacter dioxanivorans]|uniref:Uncharacterized protein n=1 Tax=Xanthobacter dioxanivorans TaxID=2528964 RepID=A0A974SI57_9HYPH|nr:hypothetical protein [Xanthobacter dioxanivorans]QRG06082.1 hypothetical protein EZH22_24330 [Xanthobacter dioxanivorans]
MHMIWSIGQHVMSYVPWWVYAIFAAGVYMAILRFAVPILGEKVGGIAANVYAIAAILFIAGDYWGDQREAWLKERAEVIVTQADINLNARADVDWSERLARMAVEAKADKEKLDALEKGSPDGCGPVPDDVLRGLR